MQLTTSSLDIEVDPRWLITFLKEPCFHANPCDNCNFRRPGSKQRQPSAKHVMTQLPTARSSFSKSPEVSRSMVSSIWKPEMVMYLSNTAKQRVLSQWTANIPASAPRFRAMPPVCHYPLFQGYYYSLSCSEHGFPLRCPYTTNPSLHLEGTAPCNIPNGLNRSVIQTYGWARSRGEKVLCLNYHS